MRDNLDLTPYEEERFVPVTEGGNRWTGRSLEDARKAMAEWPPGGRFLSGELYDGIAHIEREVRYTTPWLSVGAVND